MITHEDIRQIRLWVQCNVHDTDEEIKKKSVSPVFTNTVELHHKWKWMASKGPWELKGINNWKSSLSSFSAMGPVGRRQIPTSPMWSDAAAAKWKIITCSKVRACGSALANADANTANQKALWASECAVNQINTGHISDKMTFIYIAIDQVVVFEHKVITICFCNTICGITLNAVNEHVSFSKPALILKETIYLFWKIILFHSLAVV